MNSTVELVAALERAPSIVVPMVREAPEEILRRRPPSGKWSIHEHACHLADVHPLFVTRLERMLVHEHPVLESYDPGRDDPEDALLRTDLDDALVRFREDRAQLVSRLRELTVDEWARTAEHDEYNSYSVFVMFRHLALHDFFHAYRIEELLLRKDWPAPDPPLDSGPRESEA